MPDIIETFALSYGPAGQAAGTITLDAVTEVLTLRGSVSGTVYTMDFSVGSDNRAGLITVLATASGRYPIYQAAVGTRDSAGAYQAPLAGVTTAITSLTVTDNVATASFRDTIDGTDRTRTHVISVVGDAVKIVVAGGGSTSFTSNYSGIYGGAFSGANLVLMEIPGALAFPNAQATLGGTTWWFGHFLDISQSNAQDFTLTDPASGSLASSYSTLDTNYAVNTAGALPADLGETLWCIASTTRADVFVRPNASSERHTEIASGPWCYLTSPGAGWADKQTKVTALSTVWGFEGCNVYPQWWWPVPNFSSGPPSTQTNGSDWVAGDPAGQAAFGTAVRAVGFNVGAYNYATLEKEGTPNYLAADRVLQSDGNPRESAWEAGVWMRKTERVTAKNDAQWTDLATDLSHNMGRLDVDTYSGPTRGGGNYVDADSTSICQTLKTAIQERRRWMYGYRDTINSTDGFLFGEGGRVSHYDDMTILWAGCIDAPHEWVNTNAGYAEIDEDYPDGKSIAQWPMMLEHEWLGRGSHFQFTNNNPSRLFTTHESGLQTTPPGQDELYPFSDAMSDLKRCVALMMRRTGAIPIGTTWDTFMPEAEVVKENYITNAVCRRAVTNLATAAVIHYHSDASGYETEGARFTREEAAGAGRGRTAFVETRVRIVVGTLTIYVNRSSTDWTISGILDATGVTLPTNGYLATDTSDGAIIGSFESAVFGGNRVDLVYVHASHILIDGRGTEVSFKGATSPGGLLYMEDYTRSFALTEQAGGEVTRGALPAAATAPDEQTETTAVVKAKTTIAVATAPAGTRAAVANRTARTAIHSG